MGSFSYIFYLSTPSWVKCIFRLRKGTIKGEMITYYTFFPNKILHLIFLRPYVID